MIELLAELTSKGGWNDFSSAIQFCVFFYSLAASPPFFVYLYSLMFVECVRICVDVLRFTFVYVATCNENTMALLMTSELKVERERQKMEEDENLMMNTAAYVLYCMLCCVPCTYLRYALLSMRHSRRKVTAQTHHTQSSTHSHTHIYHFMLAEEADRRNGLYCRGFWHRVQIVTDSIPPFGLSKLRSARKIYEGKNSVCVSWCSFLVSSTEI